MTYEDRAPTWHLARDSSGAFRRFRHMIDKHHLENAWNRFRGKALEEIAIEWLDAHGIAYTRD